MRVSQCILCSLNLFEFRNPDGWVSFVMVGKIYCPRLYRKHDLRNLLEKTDSPISYLPISSTDFLRQNSPTIIETIHHTSIVDDLTGFLDSWSCPHLPYWNRIWSRLPIFFPLSFIEFVNLNFGYTERLASKFNVIRLSVCIRSTKGVFTTAVWSGWYVLGLQFSWNSGQKRVQRRIQ